MRFLNRNRVPGSLGARIHDDPVTLKNSRKLNIEKDESPPHCLAFLTKERKKTEVDEDIKADVGASTAGEIREGSGEVRDRTLVDPVAVYKMKQDTLRLVSKEQYPVGKLSWKKTEANLLIWTAQGTEDSVHLSIIILDRMLEEQEHVPQWSDCQLLYWLKAVIQNWSHGQEINAFLKFTPNDMIEQVEVWGNYVELDPEVYSMLIKGAAVTKPALADSLLRRTVRTKKRNLIYSHTYNQVIRAWVDAEEPYQAESLLDFMLSEWSNRAKTNNSTVAAKPDRQSFHWVLLGWAKSSEPKAAANTEAILDKMLKLSQSGLSSVDPNLDTYRWVLDSRLNANGKTKGIAEWGEQILIVLQEKANQGEEDFRPTTDMYSKVVAAFCEAGNPEKGEELLQRLYKDYGERNEDKRFEPNLQIFNSLLLGWTKVPSKSLRKACTRAEAILEHMSKLANSRVLLNVKPDLTSYNHVLECWSRLGDGEKAQDLLERMIDRFESGTDDIAPDTVSYSKVLSAWNRNGNRERCQFITNILHKQFCDLGNYRVHPNLILCGLARFGEQPEALRKAKALFQKCDDLKRAVANTDVKLNRKSYQHFLECIVKANRSQSGKQAEKLLDEMLEKYAAGDDDVKPNVKIYNLVIQALVETKDPKRTEEVLARMYAEDVRDEARVYPNLETFNVRNCR